VSEFERIGREAEDVAGAPADGAHWEPLGDGVVVRRDAPLEKVGSIQVPGRAQRPPQTGVVVSVGPGVQEVTPGDRVLFAFHSGQDLPGEDLLIMSVQDVIARAG